MLLRSLPHNSLLAAALALSAGLTPLLGQTNGAAATPSSTAPPATDTATPMATPPASPSMQMTTPPAANETQTVKPPVDTNAPPAGSTMAPMERPTSYTVVSGDTLWGIAQKFNTSVKKLKKLNGLTKNALKPGQTLKIPPLKSTTAASSAKKVPAKKRVASVERTQEITPPATDAGGNRLRAQPLQAVDQIASDPSSTEASSPVSDVSVTPHRQLASSPAKGAVLSQTAEIDPGTQADSAESMPAKKKPVVSNLATAPPSAPAASTMGKAQSSLARTKTEPSPWPFHWSFGNDADSETDWGAKFLAQAQSLADLNIRYNGSWRPPGESRPWVMDCSNTSRYLYKATTGLDLPRTASDQYYYLHLQNQAWDVPQTSSGYADLTYLREKLRAGDLLFWENTYRPERQPPITHVMVFLGTNRDGKWIMAGSQTGPGGEHNRRHGGPDIYLFDPLKPAGGYSTWLGLVRHRGRFCAFGRPLTADAKRLSVAAD